MTLFDFLPATAKPDFVPSDAAARERVRTDLSHNLFVEAGAGTGKTRVLVDRVAHAVATGAVTDPSRLVAITFTEAAAAELRDRIRRRLDEAVADPTLSLAEQGRCAQARLRIDEAIITTLHGFAHRILAENPLEVGLPPKFDVDDEVLARVRFAERWVRFRDELFADPAVENDLLVASALGLSSANLREVAVEFHRRWDEVVAARFTAPAPPTIDFEPITEAIESAVAAAGPVADAEGDLLALIVRDWREIGRRLAGALGAGDQQEALRVVAGGLPRRPGSCGDGELWGDRKAEVVERLNETRAVIDSHLTAWRRTVLERLLPPVAAFTHAGVTERLGEGRLEFHDLLVHARDLLRAKPSVRAALAQRIEMLLIDEFQDTDPLQLDIVFMLDLPPGTLVIVGDPKQSIYRFRGADISVWDRTKARFSGGVELLSQSFRTVPDVLGWVNAVFGHVMAEGVEGVQPRYERLDATRDGGDWGPAVVVVGEPLDGVRMPEVREREAEDVARYVMAMKAAGRPARFDDIALLLPTRTPLTQIERAFDRHEIPYRVESRSLVWATDAVRELLAVLAAIDDPADEVAVIAALRSPGFACSDVDLVRWRFAGGTWDYRREPPESVPPDDPIAQGMAALRRYHDERSDVTVNALVERVVRERRLVELTFAQRRPRDQWRRLRFVIDQARAFVEAGGRSLGEFLSWAQLQTDEGAQVVETPAPEADDDAVRILTIHGSKGLEFPVVVVAGLGSQRRDLPPKVAFGGDRPEVSIGYQGARFSTAGYEDRAAIETTADRHEGRRLLYVAATRARDQLVVALHHKSGTRCHAHELWEACHGPADGLWQAAEIPDQLRLDIQRPPAPTPLSEADRAAWIEEWRAVVAATDERRTLSATALAGLSEPAEPATADITTPGRPPTAFRRGGTAIGRAVHGVLQTLDFDAPESLPALAAVHAAAEGMPDSAADVERLAASALAAPVVREAMVAKRRWRELYVAAPLDEGRLVEGYVDLLFEDDHGDLVVVDYKTDQARTDDELDATIGRYRIQAAAYALALEHALGRRPARAVFVFARPGAAVERQITDLDAAIADARSLSRQ